MVCGIQSMAEGHTLTASSNVVFAELDWTPGKLAQAEDRCHRIGQRDSVLVQHIVLDGSMDGRMAEILVEKMGVIEAALNEGEKLNNPELLEYHADPVLPPKPAKPANGPDLTERQIAAVHLGLQQLVGMCDGARLLDGAGFNKLDTDAGHSLAGAGKLTQGQAKFGAKLCNKYRRQLPDDLLAVIKGE